MESIFRYLWDNRTTVLGYVGIVLGVLATAQDLLSDTALKWVLLINGIVTAVLGHYNNSRLRAAATAQAGKEEQ